MQTTRYMRKPFFVDAKLITDENMQEAAKWCQGDIRTDAEGKHIKVRVLRPMGESQTKAYVGDWLLYAGTGYKVYKPAAFEKCFNLAEPASEALGNALSFEEMRDVFIKLVKKAMQAQLLAHSVGMWESAENAVAPIVNRLLVAAIGDTTFEPVTFQDIQNVSVEDVTSLLKPEKKAAPAVAPVTLHNRDVNFEEPAGNHKPSPLSIQNIKKRNSHYPTS